jgi:hypothetical protein
MPNTIARNTIVQPVPVNTPLLDPATLPTNLKQALSQVFMIWGWQQWLLTVGVGVNASPQIQSTIPANSTSSGDLGDIAFDKNWLYVCVGLNTWRRVALSTF